MRFTVIASTRSPHQVSHQSLMAAGLKAHGIPVDMASCALPQNRFAACWGWRHGKSIRESGAEVLVMERGYLGDRFRWTSLGWNGLNGNADFCNKDCDDDRWIKHWRGNLRDWNERGDYALVIGQVPGDAALNGMDPYYWAQQRVIEAGKKYGRVLFRPHPLAKRKQKLVGAETTERTLQEDLNGASVVITFNSNTAVDAVMMGKPAIAYDKGSMAYAVASHSIAEPLYMGDREDWGRKIAYAQWLPDEIESGKAFSHLKAGMK